MNDIKEILKQFSYLPRSSDGRINYKNASIAPVIVVFVKYKDKILLLKRSGKVWTYKGKWQAVAGYIDEDVELNEKVKEELREEVNILEEDFDKIKFGESFEFKDIGKTWIVHPALVELNKNKKIKIDWEHTDFKWVKPEEIKDYDTVPNVMTALKRVL